LAHHHDLLEQAEHLATRESRKPRQASLRRAISTAYYALFHFLVSDGAAQCSPSKPAGLRSQVQRAFNHSEMRSVCKGFVDWHNASTKGGQPISPQPATRRLVSFPLDSRLVSVVKAFVALQEARHDADYNADMRWTRFDALREVQIARQAFLDWMAVRGTANAAVFLAALVLQKQWGR